jgi:hypothetical protein
VPQTEIRTPHSHRSFGPPTSLDALLDLDGDALLGLYRNGRVPRLHDVTGQLRGRMLAIPKLPTGLAAIARRLASSNRFPWRGKTFTHDSELRGGGVNRVVTDRAELFRFTTFIAPSRAGDFDAVQLDYDHRGNPFFIRAIKDEIREIAPGLFLGQAYVMVREKAQLVLWFGLEHPAAAR